MRPALLFVAVAAALPACGRLPSLPSLPGSNAVGGRVEVSDVGFRAEVAYDETERRRFAVAVTDARRGPSLAAEAGRVEAVRYCLTRFGGSEIGWAVPPEAAARARPDERGTLSLAGTCLTR
jgi:hypothetical protein